jgi:hypothetical protein
MKTKTRKGKKMKNEIKRIQIEKGKAIEGDLEAGSILDVVHFNDCCSPVYSRVSIERVFKFRVAGKIKIEVKNEMVGCGTSAGKTKVWSVKADQSGDFGPVGVIAGFHGKKRLGKNQADYFELVRIIK